MQAMLPVLACTDSNTDIGKAIVDGGFGWWCESNDTNTVRSLVQTALTADVHLLKQNEWDYVVKNYSSQRLYEIIDVG